MSALTVKKVNKSNEDVVELKNYIQAYDHVVDALPDTLTPEVYQTVEELFINAQTYLEDVDRTPWTAKSFKRTLKRFTDVFTVGVCCTPSTKEHEDIHKKWLVAFVDALGQSAFYETWDRKEQALEIVKSLENYESNLLHQYTDLQSIRIADILHTYFLGEKHGEILRDILEKVNPEHRETFLQFMSDQSGPFVWDTNTWGSASDEELVKTLTRKPLQYTEIAHQ